jgi:hypothetical protein
LKSTTLIPGCVDLSFEILRIPTRPAAPEEPGGRLHRLVHPEHFDAHNRLQTTTVLFISTLSFAHPLATRK